MIKEYKLYSAQCDLCGKEYPGTPTDAVIYFPNKGDVVEVIKEKGWVVHLDIPNGVPRTYCPKCYAVVESVFPDVETIREVSKTSK